MFQKYFSDSPFVGDTVVLSVAGILVLLLCCRCEHQSMLACLEVSIRASYTPGGEELCKLMPEECYKN